MSMSRDSVPENSAPGRGLRSHLTRITARFSRFLRSPGEQPASIGTTGTSETGGTSGHVGRRRAIRLAALLAPRNRRKVGFTVGLLVMACAVVASLALRRPQALPLNNAIWLDSAWTYGELEDDRLREFTSHLAENQIGAAYAYVSSLGLDGRWSGGLQGKSHFMDARPIVADFVKAFKGANDQMRMFGWVEIWTHLDNVDGYRLDDSNLHSNIADFCRLLVLELGFDGVLLDVKPLFSDNDDLIRLLGRVRSALGNEIPIAVAVAADLTPPDLRLRNIESIAPGTMLTPSFKQRLMVAADELVLLMYQSYRQEPLDYVNWVAYHVEAYIDVLEPNTKVLVSIPNYGGASSAHNPAIETMALALDGVGEGLRRLDEEKRPLLTGIAIFSDEALSQMEWKTFRDMWLQR